VPEMTIVCPNCSHEFPLTESIAAPLVEENRKQFREELAAKDTEFQAEERSSSEAAGRVDVRSGQIEASALVRTPPVRGWKAALRRKERPPRPSKMVQNICPFRCLGKRQK
jgi:hypothetical protein